MKIIFRNLSRETQQQQIHDLFAGYGRVQSCTLVMDEVAEQSKGFGFVNMPVPAEAKAAVKALNGIELDGATIRVKKAVEDTSAKPVAIPQQAEQAAAAAEAAKITEQVEHAKRMKKDGSLLGTKKPRTFKKKR